MIVPFYENCEATEHVEGRNLLDIEMLKILGPITPLGGSILIIGWICILIGILKKKAND